MLAKLANTDFMNDCQKKKKPVLVFSYLITVMTGRGGIAKKA